MLALNPLELSFDRDRDLSASNLYTVHSCIKKKASSSVQAFELRLKTHRFLSILIPRALIWSSLFLVSAYRPS